MKHLIYLFVLLFVCISCGQEKNIPERKFIAIDGLDSSIKPGDNFFRYVNGIWYDTAQIADDQVGVGSYRFLNIPQKELLQNILEEVSIGNQPNGSLEQKVGDFYASGLDTLAINQRGIEPIQPLLDRINKIEDASMLMDFVADQLMEDDYSVIYYYISPDDKNSSVNMVHVYQGGLGLPDRDYYFKTDSSTLAVQAAYQKYIATLFELTGHDDTQNLASIAYSIENQLAQAHKTRIERRDVQANYNKLAVTDIDQNQPNIGWAMLLENLGMKVDSIDVQQPAYFDHLNMMLTSVSIEDWKVYLSASAISGYVNILSQPFQDASFDYAKVLSGQSVQKSRAQQMVQKVDRQLGFALGQLYVKRYFKEDAKKRALVLVNNLQKAFENRIDNLDWMSDSTKLKAKEKLYAITKKIGYPDVWRNYDRVVIDKNKYFENVISLRKNDFKYELEQLSKAPNKEEWGTTPSTVTAYYNPSFNEIVFPAGILQFPYFDLYADDAINYGGIGMVIGHELTHAFDDQGAQFDKEGNVKNWWTEEDYEKFKAKTQQVIDLYGSFRILDSIPLKGALTVGENTADNGGIAIAYDAFKMTEQGQDTTRIDGFTPDQRFFLSVAQIWRVKTRDEWMLNYVKTDPHSPPMWRVNGPLMNMTPFYEAFDVQPGDQNYKPVEERIKIW